jgi:hypothetical protein
MTKSVFFKLGAIALALAMGLSACSHDTPPPLNNEAFLEEITIEGKKVEPLPEPISSEEWEKSEDSLTDLKAEQTVRVILDGVSLSNVPVSCTPSKGAIVWWGNGQEQKKPDKEKGENGWYYPPFLNVSLSHDPVLYFRVTSEDKKTTNYYRFETGKFDPVPTISSITIGGNTITNFNNNNSSTEGWDKITSSVKVTLSSGKNTYVKVVTSAAVIQHAKEDFPRDPVFESIDEDAEDANTFTCDFVDGDVLYIKLTTENGKNSRWYKFKISYVYVPDTTSNVITFDPAK